MATCIPKITGDLLFDCANRDLQGIETKVILINRDDIDFGASTVDGANAKIITNLQLKSGTTGFELQGVKQLNQYLAEVVPNDEGLNKWRHNFIGRIFNLTAAARNQIDLIADGANIVAVVERKWKGDSQAHAFIVLGWGTGLEISEGSENSAENDGSFVFTLASSDLALEGEGAKILLETDYITTKAAVDNKFAQA
jgi:hypothetical protein